MKVSAFVCPKCGDTVFSRALYDWRSCSCGDIYVDGGFDYNRVGYYNEPPECIELEITATKKELYDDWNYSYDIFGIIKN